MTDYRSEWLSDLLVERVTWRQDALPLDLDDLQIAGPGYVWFRFWLPDPRQIIDKYFDAAGEAVGIYLPITDAITLKEREYQTHHLLLSLGLTSAGRLTVLGEPAFEEALQTGELSEAQAERAEEQIRAVTAQIHKDRMPPALIRNFSVSME